MGGALKRLRDGRRAVAVFALAAGVWTAGLWAADSTTQPSTKPAATKPAPAKPASRPATRAAAPTGPATFPAAMSAALTFTTVGRDEVTKLPEAPNDPKTVGDLKAIQSRVEAVAKMAAPAVVSIQFRTAQGSGVIISKDGYILTAGHVSGTPGQTMVIQLADGRRLTGKALGANNGIDSGVIKIMEAGEYPFVPVGSARKLTAGQWVVAMGHPGGLVRGRAALVRLGRVLLSNPRLIGTDSVLFSGDLGGPLFDLDGKLIGINSRIGPTTTANIHVPIDTFVDTWARLAKGDEWDDDSIFRGLGGVPVGGTTLGVRANASGKGAVVTVVHPNTPAAKAGLLVGDVITMFNGKPIKTQDDLAEAVGKKRPGDAVTLGILREEKSLDISVKLGGKQLGR